MRVATFGRAASLDPNELVRRTQGFQGECCAFYLFHGVRAALRDIKQQARHQISAGPLPPALARFSFPVLPAVIIPVIIAIASWRFGVSRFAF